MRNCTATTYAVIFFGAGIGARGAAENASPDLRRPCGPLPPALRAGTPVVVLLAHAIDLMRSLRCSELPLGSPLRSSGRRPLDRRISRRRFPAAPLARGGQPLSDRGLSFRP